MINRTESKNTHMITASKDILVLIRKDSVSPNRQESKFIRSFIKSDMRHIGNIQSFEIFENN